TGRRSRPRLRAIWPRPARLRTSTAFGTPTGKWFRARSLVLRRSCPAASDFSHTRRTRTRSARRYWLTPRNFRATCASSRSRAVNSSKCSSTAIGRWRPKEAGEVGELWRHPTSDFILPVPHRLVAGGIDWQVITERLAMLEGGKAADVAARLEERALDIANLRAATDIGVRDTIPLEAGVTLVQSCWTMLRSSATTALGPRP